MARKFLASSTQYLQVTATPLSGFPATMACWAYPPTDGSAETFFAICDASNSNQRLEIRMNAGAVGDPAQVLCKIGVANSSAAINFNAWNSIVGIHRGQADRDIVLNGALNNNTTNSVITISNLDTIVIGRRTNSTPATYTDAAIAWCALWDVELTLQEAQAFCNGWHPTLIRPQNLIRFYPLGGFDGADTEDKCIITGEQLTANGSPTTQQHSGGLIYPTRPHKVISTAIAATGNRRRRILLGT